MDTVTLTTRKGVEFIIDREDYDRVTKHSWHLNRNSYLCSLINGREIRLHKLILGLTIENKVLVKQKDGNRLNNTKSNLIYSNNNQNIINQNKKVTLTTNKGLEFIIDENDFEKVSKRTWYIKDNTKPRNAYLCAKFDNKKVLLHRFVMGLTKGDKVIVDHIDGNRLNNSKSNLRIVNNTQNLANQRRKDKINTSSQYKGVWYYEKINRWRAHLRCEGVTYHLGTFKTEEAAAEAYNKKALELFKDYACINSFLPFPFDY